MFAEQVGRGSCDATPWIHLTTQGVEQELFHERLRPTAQTDDRFFDSLPEHGRACATAKVGIGPQQSVSRPGENIVRKLNTFRIGLLEQQRDSR